MKKRIIVVGGGASGMVAAIVAARQGAKVIIIEQKTELGKKLLATGNGRCNYTNLELNEDCYYCNDSQFISNVLNQYPPTKILDFFESIGITYKEKNGYVYPLTEQASSIRDALVQELTYLDVEIITDTAVQSISNHQVKTWNKTYTGDAIILATGGNSGLPQNTEFSGYDLIKNTKHKVSTLSPALVALKGEGKFFKKISGIRTEAAVTAVLNQVPVRTEIGELQLTDYGISGIPVFQISRIISQALVSHKKTCTVKIDFVPQKSTEEFFLFLQNRKEKFSNRTIKEFLNGIFKDKLNDFFLEILKINNITKVSQISDQQLHKLVQICKSFEVKIQDTNSFAQSQVTAGGISVEEVYETMESQFHKSLYFTGELLDVDGICGGYNLHFAWATGIIAGLNASKY